MAESVKARHCRCKNCPAAQELKTLQVQLKELQKKNFLLTLELKDFRERYWGNKKKKQDESSCPTKEAKKRGPPFRHSGWFRKRPKKDDKTEEVWLPCCPQCGSKKLKLCKETIQHFQEDIEPPEVKVTLFTKHVYYCSDCKEEVCGLGPGEMANSYIGPKAKSLAVWMKYAIKISERDIKILFKTLFHLIIVPGTISLWRTKLANESQGLYDQILGLLRHCPWNHADETGWKIRGEKYWLFSVSNKMASLFHIDKSRGLKVVQKLLGEIYQGILIVDFLAVYDSFQAKAKQRCLVHLLREIKTILERFPQDPMIVKYMTRLKELLQQALALHNKLKERKISLKTFKKQGRQLKTLVEDFPSSGLGKKPMERIAKRLSRYKEELFTFVEHPYVDAHNNRAEQEIRPNVIFRKITNGNDSPLGARNHSVNMTIIRTAQKNGRSPPLALEKILILPESKRSLDLLGIRLKRAKKRIKPGRARVARGSIRLPRVGGGSPIS
jgi:transposase